MSYYYVKMKDNYNAVMKVIEHFFLDFSKLKKTPVNAISNNIRHAIFNIMFKCE